jgi:site-specific DNA-methyltransferase (adenine-specific)
VFLRFFCRVLTLECEEALKPYYEDSSCVIYHGDCLEILPTLAGVQPVLLHTDPPYGIGYKPTRKGTGSRRWGNLTVRNDDAPFDPSHLLTLAPKTVLWGANNYAQMLPPSGGWIVWDKSPLGVKKGFKASHAELAWTNVGRMVRKFSLQWGGEARGGEGFFHPTQKPVALMHWVLVQLTQPGELVLDPYMGAGPGAVAARDAGRRFIGIEIEERHCETAAQRLSQETLDLGA